LRIVSGKQVAIERMPACPKRRGRLLSILAGDGNTARFLNWMNTAVSRSTRFSIERRGGLLFVLINGGAITELQIDRRVSDGRIYIASGLTKATSS